MAAGTLATDVRHSIKSRGLKLAALSTSFNSVPPWLSTVDVLVGSPGLAPSLGAEFALNQKLNAVIPAPVLYDQLISAVRSSSRLVALTNPTPQFFPDAAPALAQAEREHVQSTGYFIYAYAAVEIFEVVAQKALSVGRRAF